MAFLGSIRLRLAASYVALTLLTVALMGVLALSLVAQFATERETRALTASAQVIADQAAPLIAFSPFKVAALQELASISAFAGDARVRILGASREPLADSGAPEKNLFSITVFRSELHGDGPAGAEAANYLPSVGALQIAAPPSGQTVVQMSK
jgi:hypothetical protein